MIHTDQWLRTFIDNNGALTGGIIIVTMFVGIWLLVKLTNIPD